MPRQRAASIESLPYTAEVATGSHDKNDGSDPLLVYTAAKVWCLHWSAQPNLGPSSKDIRHNSTSLRHWLHYQPPHIPSFMNSFNTQLFVHSFPGFFLFCVPSMWSTDWKGGVWGSW